MPYLKSILYNYVLLAAILSWVAAQVAKALFTFVLSGKFKLERLFGSGGMPSSHSAMVCSLTVAISRVNGVKSIEFAIAFVLACIVMYDAMSVRRQAGEQAKVVNRFKEFLNEKNKDEKFLTQEDIEAFQKNLKEVLGHTPMEVLGGALLGILIAMVLPVSA